MAGPCVITYKGVEYSRDQLAKHLRDNVGIENLAKQLKPRTEVSPEESSNFANLTEDKEGNFVFFHKGGNDYETIQKSTGKTLATSREEAAALGRAGGAAMYYTGPEGGESMVKGSSKYAVKVAKDRVYDFNTDPENLIEEARTRFKEDHPEIAFSPNDQLAYMTKVAGERGYDMVVAEWDGKTRAQTTKEFKPSDVEVSEGAVIKKPFNEEYVSNDKKGYKSVIPETKDQKLKQVYKAINEERNSQNKYDKLYRLNETSEKMEQAEITKMIEESDISQELKDKYKEAVEFKEEKRRSEKAFGDVSKRISEIKSDTENEYGETFKPDGKVYPVEEKDDIVTLASENVKAKDLTTDKMIEFKEKFKDIIDKVKDAKIGVFRLDNGDYSIDLNTVVDAKHRENTLKFAKDNNQVSIYNGKEGEIKTGGTGETTITDQAEIIEAANKIANGEAHEFKKVEVKPQVKSKLEAFKAKHIEPVSKAREGVKTSIENAKKSLVKLLPNVEIVTHETSESFKAVAGKDARGFYDPATGKIHINLEKANGRTVAHEIFHALLLDRIKTDAGIQDITKKMVDILSKSLDNNPELKAQIEDFAKNYSENIKNEEKMSELFGHLADGYESFDAPTKSLVKRFLDRAAVLLGLKPFTEGDVVDMLNTMAGKLASGEEITEKDIEIISKIDKGESFNNEYVRTNGKVLDTPSKRFALTEDTVIDKSDIIDPKDLIGKPLEIVYYDNFTSSPYTLKNRVSGSEINNIGEGGPGYSYRSEIRKNKIVAAFTNVTKGLNLIQGIRSRNEIAKENAVVGVALQNKETGHLGNKTTERDFYSPEKGVIAQAVKDKIITSNEAVEMLKGAVDAYGQTKKGTDPKSSLGFTSKDFSTLNEFYKKIDAVSFEKRGTFNSMAIPSKSDLKITKSTKPYVKTWIDSGITTLNEYYEATSEKYTKEAEPHDIVKYFEPNLDRVGIDSTVKVTDAEIKRAKLMGVKIENISDDIAHTSYPVVLFGENIGIPSKFNSVREMSKDWNVSNPFFKAGRRGNKAEPVRIPELVETNKTPKTKEGRLQETGDYADMKDIVKDLIDEGKSISDIKKIIGSELGPEQVSLAERAHNELTKIEEVSEPKEKITSIKNAVTEAERTERGLAPIEKFEKYNAEQSFNNTKERVDSGDISPRSLAKAIIANPKGVPITYEVSDALAYDRMKLSNEYDKALNKLDKDPTDAAAAIEVERIEKEMQENDEASRMSGTISAHALLARKNIIKQDYSLDRMILKYKAKNNGEISTEKRAEFKAISDKLKEAEAKLEEYENNVRDNVEKRVFNRIKKEATTEGKKSNLKAEREDLYSKLRDIRFPKGKFQEIEPSALPEDIGPILNKLAKNLIMDGVNTLDGVIDSIHENVKDIFDGVTKRDIRDALSGYGKVSEPSKNDIDASLREIKSQVREIKSQGRLVSALEDAESGKAPLKTGFQRGTPSDRVRELQRKVQEMMKQNGITSDSVNPEKAFKTALDSIKTRLKNQIRDLEKQIRDLEKQIATGEKTAKKTGVAYDEEAKSLKQRRDALKATIESVEGKTEMSDEQRVKMAVSALDKSIAEYERRISERDVTTKPKVSKTPETDEIKVLRQIRDNVKSEYEQMKKDMDPAKSPEERALATLKTRLKKREADLQEKLDTGNFEKKERRITQPDEEAMKLKANVNRLKNKVDLEIKKKDLASRTRFKKTLDFVATLRRTMLLTGFKVLGKLSTAALTRTVISPIEEITGGVFSKLPGLSKIAKQAPREGGLNVKAEVKAISQWWQKATYKDMREIVKSGKGTLDLLHGKDDIPPSIMDFFGQLHQALKQPAKRNEYFRSFEKRMSNAAENGVDIMDPMVQATISTQAYIDANRAIFMQENTLTKAYKSFVASLERSGNVGETAATGLKIILPIVKVPTNFVGEVTSYAGGYAKALPLIGKAIAKGTKSLTPEQSDYVMRNLKKGSLGAAMIALGYFNSAAIGGYYQRGDKRDEEDVKAGGLKLFGVDMPRWMVHTPLLEMLQIGSTLKRVQDTYEEKGKEGGELAAGLAVTRGLVEEVPFARSPEEALRALSSPKQAKKYVKDLGESFINPQLTRELGLKIFEEEKKPEDMTKEEIMAQARKEKEEMKKGAR